MTVAGVSLSFEPNKTAYNNLINEMTMTNKVAPMVTYLGRIVDAESKEALNKLMEDYQAVKCRSSRRLTRFTRRSLRSK